MGKDPAFLFYYQDFLVGSDHMSLEQVGGYIKCLCHQAARYTIKESHMRNLVGSQSNFDIIREKFQKDTNNELFNERLRFEMIKRQKFTESRLSNLHKAYHMDKHTDSHMENENEIVNEVKNTTKTTNNIDTKFIVPLNEDIIAYCSSSGGIIPKEAEVSKFIDFYQSKGWMVGKSKMKDWRASWRNWMRSQKDAQKFFDGKPIAKGQIIQETPISRESPDPRQQEEVSKLIAETAKEMGIRKE